MIKINIFTVIIIYLLFLFWFGTLFISHMYYELWVVEFVNGAQPLWVLFRKLHYPWYTGEKSGTSHIVSWLPLKIRRSLTLGIPHAPKHNKRFVLSLSFSFSCKFDVTCEMCVLELFRAAAAALPVLVVWWGLHVMFIASRQLKLHRPGTERVTAPLTVSLLGYVWLQHQNVHFSNV